MLEFMDDKEELKRDLAKALQKPDPIEAVKDVAQRVAIDNDINRINAATNLVNTFNYAIQVQAGRVKWQPSDYRAFAIALVAMDSIGSTETVSDEGLQAQRAYEPMPCNNS